MSPREQLVLWLATALAIAALSIAIYDTHTTIRQITKDIERLEARSPHP